MKITTETLKTPIIFGKLDNTEIPCRIRELGCKRVEQNKFEKNKEFERNRKMTRQIREVVES